MEKDVVKASVPTLRRLAAYYHLLRGMEAAGETTVSCTQIGERMQLDPPQIRKDLQVTGVVGKPKVGYPVSAMANAISAYLGWDHTTDAFLVGAGSLGTALMGYSRFSLYGLDIVAAFDIDPAKVGTKIRGRQVLPLHKLPNLAQRMKIKVGIIAVPPEVSQTVANMMISGGIEGIWNFAPVVLDVPEDVIVETVSLASSFAVLSSRLASRRRRGVKES